ncbi:unnamed protein product [Rotaria sp. Silwood1]|nr:unnamed protein product [Rotaria sp. Silwood1]
MPIQQPSPAAVAPPYGGVFGGNPSNFGGNPSNFGGNPSNFGGNPSNFGGNPSNFGGNPSNFGGNPSNFGGNPPNFGGNPSNFGSNPSNFGGNPSNFGSYQSNFVGNPPNFGGNQSNFRGNPWNYGNNPFNFGGNQNNYQGYLNQNSYPAYPNQGYSNQNYLNQNNYSRNLRRQQRQGRFNQQQRRQRKSSQNRPRRTGLNQQRQRQDRRRPRQLKLNDFMPSPLRNASPNSRNLPLDFNLEATSSVPPDALPQRQIFASASTTQPFVVNQNDQNQDEQQQQQQNEREQTTTTTASFRRRQRRVRQQRYRQRNVVTNNRFAALADENENNDNTGNDNDNEPINTKEKYKKKTRRYLLPDQMLKWFDSFSRTTKPIVSQRANQAYLLATASIYDAWVRDNYELQLWQAYLKMGTEKKHWAKEVVRRTKQRDDIANSRFIQKKINRLVANIAKANATIADFQLQLIDYWSYANPDALAQRVVGLIAEKERTNQSTGQILSSAPLTTTITAVNATTTTSAYKDPVRETVDRIEHQILDYIYKNTSHVKKMFQGRVQLAKAEMEEFKALEDFEQVTTPSQWTIHLMLKSKVKVYSTKNKNYRIATKRVEYDLLPKFIDKIDFSFKIDESVVGKDEAQAMYDQMRKTTKDFRTQAMKLYVQSLAREHELLSNDK